MAILRLRVTDLAPGQSRGYIVEGRTVLVYNLAGRYYATQGLCSHEDLPLEGGRFTDTVIECPHHGSRFNVRTGKVLTPPASENLRTYPVTVEAGVVMVVIP